MLENFKSLLENKELTEASLDQSVKKLQEYSKQISSISKIMKSGVVRKKVSQEMGPGYNKDFDSIASSLDDALMGIEELLHEVEIETKQR